MPEKPIELTIFFAKREEQDEDRERGDQDGGHQARPVRAALRGLGSEDAEGDGEHPDLVVAADQQRPEVLVPRLMYVRMNSVMIGAELIGRTIRKKIRKWPAPSSLAASSISRLMPRKNCRRKKIANGVMKK